MRQGQHPLTHGHVGKHVVHQVRGTLGHARRNSDTPHAPCTSYRELAIVRVVRSWKLSRVRDCGGLNRRWAARYAVEKAAVLRMEFKAFLNAFIRIPVQVVRTSRRLVFRLLAWNPWQHVLLRGVDQRRGPVRC
jgi:hypothetical protein